MFKGKCELCGMDYHPADNQAQFNRNVALHKRRTHGVIGTSNSARCRKKLIEKQQLKEMGDATTKPPRKKWTRRVPVAPEAESCKLSECPSCGARFYVTRGSA